MIKDGGFKSARSRGGYHSGRTGYCPFGFASVDKFRQQVANKKRRYCRMVITDPTTALGIFYKLAQEFKEIDRRKKLPIHQSENAKISKSKSEPQQPINAIPKRKPYGY
jgi:hypothetical protein